MPGNHTVALVTRGNNASAANRGSRRSKPSNSTTAFLTNLASIAPATGLASGRAISTSIERCLGRSFRSSAEQLMSISAMPIRGLASEPMFIKGHAIDPASPPSQGAGAIHVHRTAVCLPHNRTFRSQITAAGRLQQAARTALPCSQSNRPPANRRYPEYRRSRHSTSHFQHRSERPCFDCGQHMHFRRSRRPM